jgi:hypothetical protein
MTQCLQKHVEFGFDPARRLRAFDDGGHHCRRLLPERRVRDHFEKIADAEHIAP